MYDVLNHFRRLNITIDDPNNKWNQNDNYASTLCYNVLTIFFVNLNYTSILHIYWVLAKWIKTYYLLPATISKKPFQVFWSILETRCINISNKFPLKSSKLEVEVLPINVLNLLKKKLTNKLLMWSFMFCFYLEFYILRH